MAALSDQLAIFKSATYWGAHGNLGKGFGVAYKDDAAKVQAYIAQLDAGHYDAAPPTGLETKHARGLVGMLAALAAQIPPPPSFKVKVVGSPVHGNTVEAVIA